MDRAREHICIQTLTSYKSSVYIAGSLPHSDPSTLCWANFCMGTLFIPPRLEHCTLGGPPVQTLLPCLGSGTLHRPTLLCVALLTPTYHATYLCCLLTWMPSLPCFGSDTLLWSMATPLAPPNSFRTELFGKGKRKRKN